MSKLNKEETLKTNGTHEPGKDFKKIIKIKEVSARLILRLKRILLRGPIQVRLQMHLSRKHNALFMVMKKNILNTWIEKLILSTVLLFVFSIDLFFILCISLATTHPVRRVRLMKKIIYKKQEQ